LDLGLVGFGYAFNVEDRVWSGHDHLGGWSRKGIIQSGPYAGEMVGSRYVRFREWLGKIPPAMPLDMVAYEAPYLGKGKGRASFHALRALFGLETRVEEFAAERGIRIARLHIASIKKHATGYGRATKAEMVAAMRAKGHDVTDDNEADALALLYCALGREAHAPRVTERVPVLAAARERPARRQAPMTPGRELARRYVEALCR
jgi:Holliday junction resolvasome RuvABC endonuclease subunit